MAIPTSNNGSRRTTAPRPLLCLLIATLSDLSHSYYAPFSINSNARLRPVTQHRASTSSLSARLPSGSAGGSTGDNEAVVKKPAWQENADYWADREALEKSNGGVNIKKEQTMGNTIGGNLNTNNGGNTFAHMYQQKSTDDFKKPYEDQDYDDDATTVVTRRVGSEAFPSDPGAGWDQEQKTKLPQSEKVVPEWFGSNEIVPTDEPEAKSSFNPSEGWVPDWFGGNDRVPDGHQPTTTKPPPKNARASFNSSETRQPFQMSSNVDFRKPHGSVPEGMSSSGSNWTQQHQHQQRPSTQARTSNPNVDRHAFQTTSTDDFKKPHGMPSNMEQQQRQQPAQSKQGFKASFQTSSTDDFRRSSDTSSGVGAPQQPIYQQPNRSTYTRADNPAWQNSMGQDAYGSTLQQSDPTPSSSGGSTTNSPMQNVGNRAQNAFQTIQPPKFMDAVFVDNDSLQQHAPPSSSQSADGSSSAVSPTTEFEVRDQTSRRGRDPPGDSAEYPLMATRVLVTILATLSTRYLHLYSGHSPVLASSAMTLFVSTCIDRRLGQAAFCGSFAGMSGGHLTPDVSMAIVLGALTSACYEILININNLCLGIGGRLGATAFLATSIMAKYRGVGSVGRKMRRGLWKGGPSSIVVSMVLYHVIGSVATIFLRESSVDSVAADPVRASSVVGLLGSLFLKDPIAILALYGGSFVGMSLPSRFMNGNNAAPGNRARATSSVVSLVTSFAGAGAIAGLIHATSIHSGYWNGGWGGKAGLCAFAGCWVYRGFGNAAQFIKHRT